jgi:diguanylate cyclase (GGDEF)-like protein
MSKTVRNLLLAGMLALQAVTVVAIVVLNRVNSQDVLVDQMTQIMDKVAAESVQRTEAHLTPAAHANELTVGLVDTGVLDPRDPDALVKYFRQQLQVSPQIAGMYIGFPDGGFVYLSQDDSRVENGYRLQVIDTSQAERTNTLVWLDADGVVQETERDDSDPYDPRTRPWYGDAVAAGDTIWTEPYVFYSSRAPGVTTATPLETADGDLIGVYGADTALADLSAFVSDLDVSERGTAFLVDESGGMLAYRDPEAVVRETDSEQVDYRLSGTHELDDPLVEEAFAALEAADPRPGEVVHEPFRYDGNASQAVFVPLSERQEWYVGVAAPERDFLGRIFDGQRNNAILAAIIGLVVVVLSIPFVRWIAKLFQRTHDRATTDPLTKLVNRRAFEESLHREVVRARRQNHPLSASLIDVDFFKKINDTYGHSIGDEALVAVAKRLEGGVRETDVVCRLGGDEFAILLLDTDVDEASEILERIRATIADAPTATTKGPVAITLTLGVAELTADMGDGEALIETADTALYLAKEGGRNRVAGPRGLVDRMTTRTGAPADE